MNLRRAVAAVSGPGVHPPSPGFVRRLRAALTGEHLFVRRGHMPHPLPASVETFPLSGASAIN